MFLYIQVEKECTHRRVTSANMCGKWELGVSFFLLRIYPGLKPSAFHNPQKEGPWEDCVQTY